MQLQMAKNIFDGASPGQVEDDEIKITSGRANLEKQEAQLSNQNLKVDKDG